MRTELSNLWLFQRNGAVRLQLPAHIQDNNGTLFFQDVRATDKGLYACFAKNADGFINTTIYVDVIGEFISYLNLRCVGLWLSADPPEALLFTSFSSWNCENYVKKSVNLH